ncbi:MAG: glycerophosphodiester phosphodiesterase [Rhizobiaceae bacterium]
MSSIAWIKNKPVAHRGLHDGNKKIWENTFPAFSAAIEHGFPIECDLHMTKDGVPMVFHDSPLKRLTGEDGHIRDKTAKQMAELHIGGTSERVKTLDEMLAHVAGKAPLVIELKGDEGHDGSMVKIVAKSLSKYRGKAAIMSFDHHLIRDFAKHAPDIAGGLTAEGIKDADIEAHFSMLAHGISFVSYSVHHLPNRFISMVRTKLKMPVITWTVRTVEDLAKTYAEADQATFELINPVLPPK